MSKRRLASRLRRKPPVAGVTLNGGKPMRLRTPFDTIAMYDGAIHLSCSTSASTVLMVPRDAGAFLGGFVTEGTNQETE